MSRDNARTPMQWDASSQAGFSTGTPWIGVNPNHKHINAAAQLGDPTSVFHHYRRVIALRHDDPVVAHGSFRMLVPEDDKLYAFVRTLNGSQLLVLANFSSTTIDVSAVIGTTWAGSALVLGNYPDAAREQELRPWEARVHRL